jgi:ArsR family transcriptional regulator, arsenate/arsenite/antimonite-responsive transcriptional repressor
MDRQDIAKIGKALGDPTRLQILEAIASNGQICGGELVSLQKLTPGTISHHLKILGEAGLIGCRRKGQFVYSYTNPKRIREYTRALSQASARRQRAGRKRSSRRGKA